MYTPELNKVKTCLIKICQQGGLKFGSSKWLQSAIYKLEKSKPDLVKLVKLVWTGYKSGETNGQTKHRKRLLESLLMAWKRLWKSLEFFIYKRRVLALGINCLFSGELLCTRIRCATANYSYTNYRSISDNKNTSESSLVNEGVTRDKDWCLECDKIRGPPVCGPNWKTYRSACHAYHCAGFQIDDVKEGKCESFVSGLFLFLYAIRTFKVSLLFVHYCLSKLLLLRYFSLENRLQIRPCSVLYERTYWLERNV